jgi:hypothetical protein
VAFALFPSGDLFCIYADRIKSMQVEAQRISTKKDGITLCRPSMGYGVSNLVKIELDAYEEVGTFPGELPDNDQSWPKGAPLDQVKVGGKILKRKTS